MENKTYLVKLTPLGKYYFGSENTFNAPDKGDSTKVSVNYLVRSRMYPQQTTLLGLMRYVLLLKYNLLHASHTEKEKRIGKTSFRGADPGSTTNWGMIQSISPLFLQSAHRKYVVAGYDVQLYKKNNETALVRLQASDRQGASTSYSTGSFSLLTGYDAKQHAQLLWKDALADNEFKKQDDIFTDCFQVGITKSFQGNTANDAFYKQYFYTLNKGFCFAFYLTTNAAIQDAEQPVVTPFGADQSLFRIELEEEENKLFPPEISSGGDVKITLLSDAYCEVSVLNDCYLSITQSVDFRYIKTNVETTKRYANMSKKPEDMQKSAKLNLLERGSVLYSKDATEIIKELQQYPAYRNAGFNHFTIQSLQPK